MLGNIRLDFCGINCAWDVIKLAQNCVQCTVSPFAKQLAKILGSAGNTFFYFYTVFIKISSVDYISWEFLS